MNKKIQRTLALVATAAVALGVVTTSSAQAAKHAKKKAVTVYLAYQGPLSGGEAAVGTDEQNAVKYAIKLYMATKPKVKVKLVSVDDQGDPSVAAVVAPGVGANAKIIGLIGPAYSGATIASLPYYKVGLLPLISPSATRVSLTDPNTVNKADYGQPVFHRIVATDDKQGPALAKWATKGVTSPKVFVFDDQSAYGVPLAGYVTSGLTKLNIPKVGGDSVPNTTTDFAGTIAKIKTSGANVVIYTGYFSQGALFIKQLRDSGSTAIFGAGDGVFSSEFPKLAGKAAEGARITGVSGLADANPAAEVAFKKSMGISSGVYAVESFDATNIFLAGIKAGKLTRSALLIWVKGYTGTGIGGTEYKFNKHGDIEGDGFSGFETVNGVLVNKGPVK